MTQAGKEGLSQEPIVKMTREVGVSDIQAILGEGTGKWDNPMEYVLTYPEIAVKIVSSVTDVGLPLRLRSLNIGGQEVMQFKDVGVVLDITDDSVTFVNPLLEKMGNRVRGFTLSTKLRTAHYSEVAVDSIPAGSRLVYSVLAANLAASALAK